jgi:hypothetical protein
LSRGHLVKLLSMMRDHLPAAPHGDFELAPKELALTFQQGVAHAADCPAGRAGSGGPEMKNGVWLALMMVLAVAPAAWARLGETAEQCSERYGRDFTEKPASNFWAFERIYVKNGIEASIRFLAEPRGVNKAGWVRYKPLKEYKNKFSDELLQSLLHTVPGDWQELVRTSAPPATVHGTEKDTSAKDLSKKERDALEARGKRIKETVAEIEKVAGNPGKCWAGEKAYATAGKNGLTIFSEEYLGRFERWSEAEAKRKERDTSRPPPGF